MEALEAWLAVLGLTLKTFLGGTVGAVIQLKFWDGLGAASRVTTILAGIALAWLFTRPLLTFFKLAAADYELAVAGGLGVGGMAIIAGAWKTAREVDWKGLIERALGRKLGGGS